MNQSRPAEVSPIVYEALQSPGHPLDAETRTFMESHFGHDFSHVRIHTDTKAAQSTRAMNSLAYTVGHDIVFGEANHDLGTIGGQWLLAHELTHVAQETGGSLLEVNDNYRKEAVDAIQHVLNSDRAYAVGIDPSHKMVRSAGHVKRATEHEADSFAWAITHGEPIQKIRTFVPVSTIQQAPNSILSLLPSALVPGLSNQAVTEANNFLTQGKWQEAVDVIVDDMVRSKQIDRNLLLGGRVHVYLGPTTVMEEQVLGEGLTLPRGFRRDGAGSPTAIPIKIRLGGSAFTRGISWLYSTIVHEYQHVLQLQHPAGLPTISSPVPGQRTSTTLVQQQDVDAYAIEILQARKTGVANHPDQIKEIWRRLHAAYIFLRRADRQPVYDIYIRAHTEAEAILGAGSLPNFRPLPP